MGTNHFFLLSIAARKKELADQQKAAQKAANDPSQYVSNRAKMLKDQASNSPERKSEKVNRLDAMAKISDTFGYGEKIKKEAPPMKKPLTTEPKTKKKIQTGSKSKVETKPSTQKPKPPAG